MDAMRGCPMAENGYHLQNHWDYWDGDQIACGFCGARRKPRPQTGVTEIVEPSFHDRWFRGKRTEHRPTYEYPYLGVQGKPWVGTPPSPLKDFVDIEMYRVEAAFNFFSSSEQVKGESAVIAAVNAWALLRQQRR